MKPRQLALGLLLSCAIACTPAEPDAEPPTSLARGSFEVKLNPQQTDNPEAAAAGLMRMSLDKRYHGPLDATAQGEMMARGDGTDSGAYVAIEKVHGTLDGRRGSFALVHMGIMRGPVPEYWTIKVIPDSGTDELEGIEGEMTITIDETGHHYQLQYQLP